MCGRTTARRCWSTRSSGGRRIPVDSEFFTSTWYDRLQDAIGHDLHGPDIKNLIEDAVTSTRSPMVTRLEDEEPNDNIRVYAEMKRKWRITVDMDRPRQSLKNEENWQRDPDLKHYIWERIHPRNSRMMAGDKHLCVRGDDYNLGDDGILKVHDTVLLDGRRYEFLGYYRQKDLMMFKRKGKEGLDPDRKMSEEEFQQLRTEGKFERDLPDIDCPAELPEWIDNRYLVAYRVFDNDCPESPFVGFDEEQRAVFIAEDLAVCRRKTTPKDVGDVDERNIKEIERRARIEGIARQLVNQEWDWYIRGIGGCWSSKNRTNRRGITKETHAP